ncbi:hypothetical protein, partial [Scardovia wiggsiae]|uniref:hypothetical protein n=1 Tax=Scardovia wiggsiae TaxID=230143 RepID=UPI00374FD25D
GNEQARLRGGRARIDERSERIGNRKLIEGMMIRGSTTVTSGDRPMLISDRIASLMKHEQDNRHSRDEGTNKQTKTR